MYVSIDIETTGLDPETDQVLEVAAVIDDWKTPLYNLPQFNVMLHWERLSGSPFALALNAKLIERILKSKLSRGSLLGDKILPSQLSSIFGTWLLNHGLGGPIQVAGKNFAGFDRPFLAKHLNVETMFSHRVLDLGSLFWVPGEKVPSSDECRKRAGLEGETKHTALDDALDVVRMIRRLKGFGVQ